MIRKEHKQRTKTDEKSRRRVARMISPCSSTPAQEDEKQCCSQSEIEEKSDHEEQGGSYERFSDQQHRLKEKHCRGDRKKEESK